MPEHVVKPTDDLPTPSANTVLWRVSMMAFLRCMPRKRAERFLRLCAETLATEDSVSNILPIRPRSDEAAVQQARREAVAVFRQYLPVFFASLDED